MYTEGTVHLTSDHQYDIQSNYEIKLDDVNCYSDQWSDCAFSETNDCSHSEDVFLECQGKRLIPLKL